MPLTETQVRNAKSQSRPYRLYDGLGLYLEVSPSGTKFWRLKFQRANGKENRLALGRYPEMTLAEARRRRLEARRLLAEGVDLVDHREAQKAAKADHLTTSFEAVAREWLAMNKDGWASTHYSKILGRFEKDVFPYIGKLPIDSLKAPQILAMIRRIESRGVLETAHRALANCGQVFRYAVATGRAERDPTGDLRGALPSVSNRRTHFAAIIEPKEVGALLRAFDSYHGSPVVRAALQLAPLVFVRPGELRSAKWADIDFEKAEWRFTTSKTKTQHIVPLATQAIAILKEIQPLTGASRFAFPSPRTRDRCMSENAILSAMRRMGIEKDEMSGHGFRAMARTILDEVLRFPVDRIEHQLAHAVRDPLGRAYNRATHIEDRRLMMQVWADYLDSLKSGAVVIPIGRRP
ncbi:integrase arm-type DNA-binding domain-containing protein [Massilia sp. TS11]|uniref:tyrosine-type recombinase/integrase n=1 Tax=Massilia sp. TS11 TaxID=2908003 RepID=UPI001EDA151F|nr:integrase arm-type DNA-binding domain-containing protein [Massilia sp. TS11]